MDLLLGPFVYFIERTDDDRRKTGRTDGQRADDDDGTDDGTDGQRTDDWD